MSTARSQEKQLWGGGGVAVREGRICGGYLGTYSQNTRKFSESVNVADYLQI